MSPEDREDRGQVITAMFVVVTIFAVLCALAGTSHGDDAAYWRARVNAAIAINASVVRVEQPTQTLPEAAKPPAKPKAEAKPEVWTFYAPFHCPPCESEKAEIKAWKDSPFAFRNGDINNAPITIESYPTTAWRVNGQWWSYSGWHGVKHLEGEWERSRKTTHDGGMKPNGSHVSTDISRGTTRYTWPGDLRHHLRTTHGITESLTHEQAVLVHDAIHSGYSVSQIRTWARSRGYIR
jgi:hypothetical protein